MSAAEQLTQRVVRVFNSCQNVEQMRVAQRYAYLVSRHLVPQAGHEQHELYANLMAAGLKAKIEALIKGLSMSMDDMLMQARQRYFEENPGAARVVH